MLNFSNMSPGGGGEPVFCDVGPAMSVTPADSQIFGTLFGTDEMRGIFADRQFVQRMLDVDAAPARAQARLGIIPQAAAGAIPGAPSVHRLHLAQLGASTRKVGYPAVRLTTALRRAAWQHALCP